MKKITEINIINYRAFYNEKETLENKSKEKYKIELKNGENLLVYGENGSGKSSLFKALQDFFETIQGEIDFTSNVYSDTTTPEPEIQITFSGDELKYRYNRLGSDVSATTFLQNISTSFLSYRDILKTYFFDIEKDKDPNLFSLFVDNLLKRITDNTSNTDLINKLKEIRIKRETFDEALKQIIGDSRDKSFIKQSFEDLKNPVDILVNDFNTSLLSILKPVLKMVNKYLKDYFNLGFKISLKGEKFIKIQSKKFQLKHSEALFFNIELHNKKIENHTYQSFLNEARLSALAVSIYLAANKIESDIVANRDLKLLFLDDIFIGLDTANRIPLLKLLESDDFKDWQVFITTYDRHWFEVAKRWFNQSKLSFKPIELYVDNMTIGTNQIESPLLIDNSMDYFEKAKLYFKKKDYPASANYLRKACEKELKRILPQNLLLKEKKDKGEIRIVEELGKLFDNFKIFCSNNSLDFNAFAQFETYTKIIYNSLSHDDLTSPFYKKEIEEGIELVLKLKEIQIKQIISVENSPITISLWTKNDTTKQLHSYSIVLKENLFWIKQGNSDLKFSASLCLLQTPTGNHEIKFQDALLLILKERSYLFPDDYNDLCKNLKVSGSKRLKDLIQ